MSNPFLELGLAAPLAQSVVDRGYEVPTPIQSAAIPLMVEGHDVIGQAQTGTGKTAAFALPILQNLTANQKQVQALIIAPTRELAMQVAKATAEYGRDQKVRVLAVYGGQAYVRQISRLRSGVDIVVGTPGRLLDLIDKKVLHLGGVHTVVLDEADEMLSLGFIEDIESILQHTPDARQTALFSATLPPRIRQLADKYMRTPRTAKIKKTNPTVDAIEQVYYLVNEKDKTAALTRLFEIEEIERAIIFARTRAGTGQLANELVTRGFPAEALNGDMSQESRTRVLQRFRNNQLTVLVATDVAARGLDIDDVSHVFNYDLPQDPEIYVHRVGRTGRAGKTGIAASLITPREQWQLQRIENMIKRPIALKTIPGEAEILEHRERQLVERIFVWLRRGRCQREREIVEEMVAEGQDVLDIAAVALKMARAEEKQRPIAPVSPVQLGRSSKQNRNSKNSRRRERSTPKSHESGMVRLTVGAGRAQGTRINDIVSSLAGHTGIPGSAIGKIQLQDHETLVDIPERMVDQVLALAGSYRIRKRPVTLERAS